MRSRFLTPRIERSLERAGFAVYALVAVILVGQSLISRFGGTSVPTPSPSSRVEEVAASATASPIAIPTPASTPSPSPQPTADALVVTTYVNAGRRFAALSAPTGYVLTSPIDGTVNVVVYQFLNGDIRVGSNIPSEPFYPYVTLTSSEVRLVLRPGALRDDVELLVKDGDAIRVGSPLFKIVGTGASSWHTFYDRTFGAQVLVSETARPSGVELDPVALWSH